MPYHLAMAPDQGQAVVPERKRRQQQTDDVFCNGAAYEARTRYLHLGKVALYQMS